MEDTDADETYVDVSVNRGEPPPTPPAVPSTSKGQKPQKKTKEPNEPKELIVPDGLSLGHRDPQGIHVEDDYDLKVSCC